jgi:hypothetical protein
MQPTNQTKTPLMDEIKLYAKATFDVIILGFPVLLRLVNIAQIFNPRILFLSIYTLRQVLIIIMIIITVLQTPGKSFDLCMSTWKCSRTKFFFTSGLKWCTVYGRGA